MLHWQRHPLLVGPHTSKQSLPTQSGQKEVLLPRVNSSGQHRRHLRKILCHFNQFGRPCYVLHACQNFDFGTWGEWPLHSLFSADRGEWLQGTHLEITLVTVIGTIIWNIWHSSWILQHPIFLPTYHPHQTWLKGGMKSCERIDQQHLQVDTCMDCSILGNFSISQAWAGLHFNVITHKVLHSSKIRAEFLYAIWEGPLRVTAKLIEMAQ